MGINITLSPLGFNAFRPNVKRTVLVSLKIMTMVSVSDDIPIQNGLREMVSESVGINICKENRLLAERRDPSGMKKQVRRSVWKHW